MPGLPQAGDLAQAELAAQEANPVVGEQVGEVPAIDEPGVALEL